MNQPTSPPEILYGLDSRPPLPRALILGLQHVLTMFGATIAVPLLLGPAMGATPDQIGLMISSVMICSGLATLIQVTIGSRLPIIQGVSFSFLAAFFFIIASVANDPQVAAADKVSESMRYIAGAVLLGAAIEVVIGFSGLIGLLRRFLTPVVIGPVIMLIGLALFPFGAPWAGRDWLVSGLVIILILLFSLVLSRRSRFIQLFPILLAILAGYGLCVILSLSGMYQPRITVLPAAEIDEQSPFPTTEVPNWIVQVRKPAGNINSQIEDQKAASVGATLLPGAKGIYIVDASKVDQLGWERIEGAQWDGYVAARRNLIAQNVAARGATVGDWGYIDFTAVGTSDWFRKVDPKEEYAALQNREAGSILFPWGFPKWSLAFFFAVLAGYLASMIESFGDYHACSVMAGAGNPSFWQISRGIGAEGLGCGITGCLGGFASTSYSENIGLIGITKVGSRFVVTIGAFFLIALGFFTKLGAIISTLPTPIVGALYCALFGLISAVGIQQLSKADLRSDRTLMIAGFSLFMGLSVPAFIAGEQASVLGTFHLWIPNFDTAQTLGETFVAIGKSGMAVAAIIGLVLDNLIPGKMQESEEG